MAKYIRCLTLLILLSGMCYGQSYVGPEKCLQCHNNPTLGDATGWRVSLHANGYSYVPDDSHSMEDRKGVIADYDQNGVDDFKDGLDFNKISSAFDPYKPNAPVLSYDSQKGYQIKIGEVTHKVYMTYGGSGLYKQRYMVKIKTSEGESTGYYVSPIQFNEKTHEYVLYHPDAWYDASNKPIYTLTSTRADAAKSSRNMAKGCSGCHVTGLTVSKDSNGEWTLQGAPVADEAAYASYNNIFDIDGDGDLDQINTTCERCHGPGGDHASAPSKTNIINPEDLTAEQANNLCGMCHSRGHSLPNGTFSFPFNDDKMTSWVVGDLVKDYYSDGGGYWGDKKNSKKHHQQFFDFYRSPKPTFEFHKVRCYECHDVHNTAEHHIRETIMEEDSQGNPLAIATEPDNNSLCLACHATHGPFAAITKEMVADLANNEATIAAIVSKHTNHSYDPENKNSTGGASRCSKCHMPKIAKSAIAYDIHSHTFEPISPAKTLKYEMPNSCAVSCHNKNNYTFGVDMSGDVFTSWNEATDKNLAAHLLFWYENQWFHETNQDGNMVNAKLVTTAPTLDGDDTDAAWAGTDYVTIPLAAEKSIDVKAVFTSTDLYMLFKWADPTASFTRSGSWSYDGGAWKTSSGQNEDRIAVMWNISIPDAAWNGRGCMNKCHRNVDNKDPNQDKTTSEDDAYLPAGQKADMWHMKAARSLPTTSASASGITVDPSTHEVTGGSVVMVGYMDDKYIGEFDANNAPDGGRYGDAGSSTYGRNRNAAKTGPKYIEKDPTDFMDAMVLTQSEIDGGEAVEVDKLSTSDIQTYWAKYAALNAVVPERILRTPAGSRGDIMQAAKWENGYWITEIKRALNTGNSDDDAAFAPNGSYGFGIAVMDNAGGDGHWTTGKALAKLNLGTTGIAERLADVPGDFNLAQNYPNPFNPSTVIEFTVPKRGRVELKVFSSLGQEITVLINKDLAAGTYKVNFDASRLPSGLYYYRMTASGYVATRKMVLMK